MARRYSIPNLGAYDAGIPILAPRIYPEVDPLAAVLHTFLTSLDARDQRKAEGVRANLAERKFQSEERVTQATLAAKLQELLFKQQELGEKAEERKRQAKAMQGVRGLRAPVIEEFDEEVSPATTQHLRREPILRGRVFEPDDDVLEGAMQAEGVDPADAATRDRLRQQLAAFLDLGETDPQGATATISPAQSQRVRTSRPPTPEEFTDRLSQVEVDRLPPGFLDFAKLLMPPDPMEARRKEADLKKAIAEARKSVTEADNLPAKLKAAEDLAEMERELKRLKLREERTREVIRDKGVRGESLTGPEKVLGGFQQPEPGRETAPPQPTAVQRAEATKRARQRLNREPTDAEIADELFQVERDLRTAGAAQVNLTAGERAQSAKNLNALALGREIQQLVADNAGLIGGTMGAKGRANSIRSLFNAAPDQFPVLEAKLGQLRAQLINALAGAAIGPSEAQLYLRAFPDTNQSDQTFAANLQATLDNVQRLESLARQQQRRGGVDAGDDLDPLRQRIRELERKAQE